MKKVIIIFSLIIITVLLLFVNLNNNKLKNAEQSDSFVSKTLCNNEMYGKYYFHHYEFGTYLCINDCFKKSKFKGKYNITFRTPFDTDIIVHDVSMFQEHQENRENYPVYTRDYIFKNYLHLYFEKKDASLITSNSFWPNIEVYKLNDNDNHKHTYYVIHYNCYNKHISEANMILFTSSNKLTNNTLNEIGLSLSN